MTTDDEKDPPVPSYLEGITLKRVHDGKVIEEEGDDGSESSPSSSS